VGDKDQRVWNDDDEVVAEDVLAAVESSDDLDDDYEPPIHVDNPWTRSLQNRRRQQGSVCIYIKLILQDQKLSPSELSVEA